MKFAIYKENQKTEVSYSGQIGLCPTCKGKVVGKIYRDKLNHWAHLKKDCDSWYEPISEWHLKWQNFFPVKNQEVTLFNKNTGEKHRADILLDNGLVIEVQNSNIKISEVEKREEFYGEKGLIWILNGNSLAIGNELVNNIYPREITVTINIDVSEISDFVFIEIFNYLKTNSSNNFIFQKNNEKEVNSIRITIKNHPYPDWIKKQFEFELDSFRHKNYRYISSDTFKEYYKINLNISSNKYILEKYMSKHRVKKFINEMKFPIFIDNLRNLDEEYLYWFQKDKLVKKKDFLNKYLSYCNTTKVY